MKATEDAKQYPTGVIKMSTSRKLGTPYWQRK